MEPSTAQASPCSRAGLACPRGGGKKERSAVYELCLTDLDKPSRRSKYQFEPEEGATDAEIRAAITAAASFRRTLPRRGKLRTQLVVLRDGLVVAAEDLRIDALVWMDGDQPDLTAWLFS